jgi:hypothetical protein
MGLGWSRSKPKPDPIATPSYSLPLPACWTQLHASPQDTQGELSFMLFTTNGLLVATMNETLQYRDVTSSDTSWTPFPEVKGPRRRYFLTETSEYRLVIRQGKEFFVFCILHRRPILLSTWTLPLPDSDPPIFLGADPFADWLLVMWSGTALVFRFNDTHEPEMLSKYTFEACTMCLACVKRQYIEIRCRPLENNSNHTIHILEKDTLDWTKIDVSWNATVGGWESCSIPFHHQGTGRFCCMKSGAKYVSVRLGSILSRDCYFVTTDTNEWRIEEQRFRLCVPHKTICDSSGCAWTSDVLVTLTAPLPPLWTKNTRYSVEHSRGPWLFLSNPPLAERSYVFTHPQLCTEEWIEREARYEQKKWVEASLVEWLLIPPLLRLVVTYI